MQYDLGKRAIESGASYVNAQLERVNYGRLCKYFDIDNSYLASKLYLIVFPFRAVPQDLYRPDLFIPVASLVTLLLFRSFLDGLRGNFDPERLCLSATRHLCFHGLLVAGYKAASYAVAARFAVLDIVALAGYKYAAAALVRGVRLLPFGALLRLLPTISFFFFLSRSLKRLLLAPQPHRRALYFLFGMAVCEMLIMLFISQ